MRTTATSPHTRMISSPEATDLYFTAIPDPVRTGQVDSARKQAEQLYLMLREALVGEDAWVFSERIFASPDAWYDLLRARNRILKDRLDGVPPTCLATPPNSRGPVIGIQVHAISSERRPTPLRCWSRAEARAGRIFDYNDKRWFFLSGRSAPGGMPTDACAPGSCHEQGECSPDVQAERTFHCATCLLHQAGGGMKSVARTWLWLDRILDWYKDLNVTRNRFFREEGLISPDGSSVRMPASTGIGVAGALGRPLTLELIAMPGQEDQIRTIEAGGDQDSAFRYGSAFSRACIAPMPGGPTLFISGTAAIDARGKTEHVGDIDAQIEATLAHVRALLNQANCIDEDVVTSLVYCKSTRVQDAFNRLYPQHPWPLITMVGDVCRDDLLFEVEVTANAHRSA